jgi:hypothetical protein
MKSARKVAAVRHSRKGTALAAAMMFFVMITIAATALLSISAIHRIQIVRSGIDVRLMIAAEAGIETVRGRFTIIPVIQEDWNQLVGSSGWNQVEDLTINGITVRVEAHPVGGPSVPTARIRSTAFAQNKARTVEYTIRVASFSDFSIFNSSTATSNPGVNYKAVGNTYYGGSVNVQNTGIQFFGDMYAVGTTNPVYGSGSGGNNSSTGQAWDYHFPYGAPALNQPPIPLPTWASPWQVLEDVAEDRGHLWGENTLGIQLMGDRYRRWFVQRHGDGSGPGVIPSGHNWLNWIPHGLTGAPAGPSGRIVSGASSITNVNYRLATEVLPIPDEGVIYVKEGHAESVSAGMDVFGTGTNGWRQTPTSWSGKSPTTWTNYRANATRLVRNSVGQNNPDNDNGGFTRAVLLWGHLDGVRVSIGSDYNIILSSNVTYQSLMDNPELRAFFGDQANGKESPAALGITEMLGVMSQQDVHLASTWWTPLPSSQGVPNGIPGDLFDGDHHPTDTYAIDGVYFALGHVTNTHLRNAQRGELWMHGGVIGGGTVGWYFGTAFRTRNYHWDFRMRTTTPPYFLRAYNASAVFMPGTWRTYESTTTP